MFSCVIVSSLIVDLGNSHNDSGSNKIIYEAEEFEDLCGGIARASVYLMEGDDIGIAYAYCEGSAIAFGEIGLANSGWYDFEVSAGIPEETVWDDEIGEAVIIGHMDENDAGGYYIDGFSDFCGAVTISSVRKMELIAEAELEINSKLYTLVEGQWVVILYDEDREYQPAPRPEGEE